jgi:hypothetical protein
MRPATLAITVFASGVLAEAAAVSNEPEPPLLSAQLVIDFPDYKGHIAFTLTPDARTGGVVVHHVHNRVVTDRKYDKETRTRLAATWGAADFSLKGVPSEAECWQVGHVWTLGRGDQHRQVCHDQATLDRIERLQTLVESLLWADSPVSPAQR